MLDDMLSELGTRIGPDDTAIKELGKVCLVGGLVELTNVFVSATGSKGKKGLLESWGTHGVPNPAKNTKHSLLNPGGLSIEAVKAIHRNGEEGVGPKNVDVEHLAMYP